MRNIAITTGIVLALSVFFLMIREKKLESSERTASEAVSSTEKKPNNRLPKSIENDSSKDISEKVVIQNSESVTSAAKVVTVQLANPRKFTTDDQALEDQAVRDLKENETDRAEATLRTILEQKPGNNVALGELILLLETSKRVDEAKDLLENIVGKCADCNDARLALGEIYLNEKSYEQAAKFFKEAAEASDVKEAALRKLYFTYSKAKKTNEAIVALKELITSSNNEIHRLKRLGVATNILEQTVNSDRKELAKLEHDLQKEG